MGTEMPQQTQGPCAECGCEYVRGSSSDERRHRKIHDRVINGNKTTLSDGYHFVTHRSPMAIQRLAYAAACEAHYENEYDIISFSAQKIRYDEFATIAVIFVSGGRVCGLIVSRVRECVWKARLDDIKNNRSNEAERVPQKMHRAVDMIWVLKSSRRRGIAKGIVRELAENCKIDVDSLAHLKPLSKAAIGLWKGIGLSTIYLA